jgi:hypothetical protein
MRTLLVLLLVVNSHTLAQESGYGKRNGYDWKNTGSWIVQNIEKTSCLEKKSWTEAATRQLKEQFILGMAELYTRIPTESFGRYKDEKGRWQYFESLDPYPYLVGTTPDQVVKGLDGFYDDYKNLNVLILDAIHVVQMEIKGQSQEDIDWQTRYYRADEDTRWQMVRDKYSKPKK